ncbi:hypothetical protein FBR07_04325 [Candidatus Uhrbacteria bacterium UHB]|uniref:Uncharacterized protein n=1 Tax=candidate division WWE3 bacterium TaxID=2053526 RepID=A0A928Y651_UNCKA|nr:hypothetical protein [candidate division WWE3 bacterium]MDL1953374.1 hypothetical protein [Candidatus Uhrbacteria bacterium UHB]RIL00742.1 MAG: hypothetical protein DCC77_04370 [Candidatus Uhrbacteria bacterium]
MTGKTFFFRLQFVEAVFILALLLGLCAVAWMTNALARALSCEHTEPACIARTFSYNGIIPALRDIPEFRSSIGHFEVRIGRCKQCLEPEFFCAVRVEGEQDTRRCPTELALGCADHAMRSAMILALMDYRASTMSLRSRP